MMNNESPCIGLDLEGREYLIFPKYFALPYNSSADVGDKYIRGNLKSIHLRDGRELRPANIGIKGAFEIVDDGTIIICVDERLK